MALLCSVTALYGCHGGGSTTPTAEPTAQANATDDPSSQTDGTAEATELPEYMWTPDPALYILGEDGFFEDKYLTAYLPTFLEYKGHYLSNSAQYSGYPEGYEKKVVLSYTPDEGGVFDNELEGLNFTTYEKYLQENVNSYFYLQEFGYTLIDGHRAMRAAYIYDPPEEPEHFCRLLQYNINVNGWVLGICFSTQADAFPPECDASIKTIRFKDGYR